MKIRIIAILLLALCVFPSFAQFDFGGPVSESGYGLVKTNLTFSYDHVFGSVPDNLSRARCLTSLSISLILNSRLMQN